MIRSSKRDQLFGLSSKRIFGLKTSSKRGIYWTAIAISVLVAVLVAVTVLLLISTSNPALLTILGVIVGAVFGVIGTVVKTMVLDPEERRTTREEDAKMARKALYNQLMLQFLLAKYSPGEFSDRPDLIFKSNTYASIQRDPIFFYSMLPDAEALDLAFSSLGESRQFILSQKNADDSTKQRIIESFESFALSIERLIEYGVLDLDLIEEVCATTPDGQRFLDSSLMREIRRLPPLPPKR